LLIFDCWHGRPGIEPTNLDLNSQSGAYDLSATATPDLSFDWFKGTIKYISLVSAVLHIIIKKK